MSTIGLQHQCMTIAVRKRVQARRLRAAADRLAFESGDDCRAMHAGGGALEAEARDFFRQANRMLGIARQQLERATP